MSRARWVFTTPLTSSPDTANLLDGEVRDERRDQGGSEKQADRLCGLNIFFPPSLSVTDNGRLLIYELSLSLISRISMKQLRARRLPLNGREEGRAGSRARESG